MLRAMEQQTHGEAQTAALATAFARGLGPGDVVALRGPLGAGKSVFARAVIRALAGDAGLVVPSPTFTLVQTYATPGGEVWHFDLYRLESCEEVWELGWDEARAGIMLIEWPERAGPHLPASRWEVTLEPLDGVGRTVTIVGPDGAQAHV
jgi:tRNA threonylcarbamoyladenosine biosynthesis protein TsaE